MTRLAFGSKCGVRGDRGFFVLPAEDNAPAALSAPSIEPSAMLPKPTPHWRRNHRRETSLAYSFRISFSRFMLILSSPSHRDSAGRGRPWATPQLCEGSHL